MESHKRLNQLKKASETFREKMREKGFIRRDYWGTEEHHAELKKINKTQREKSEK